MSTRAFDAAPSCFLTTACVLVWASFVSLSLCVQLGPRICSVFGLELGMFLSPWPAPVS